MREAVRRRIPVVGDIELFAWHNTQPVLAVTGTNGKTTVTALAGHLLRSAGLDCEVAGNIGPPVLDAPIGAAPRRRPGCSSSPAISSRPPGRSRRRRRRCSTSPRIISTATRASTIRGAARIFIGTGVQVLNRDDARSIGMALPGREVVTFGLDAPPNDAGFRHRRRLSCARRAQDPAGGRAFHPRRAQRRERARGMRFGFSREITLAHCVRPESFKGLPHRLELWRRAAASSGTTTPRAPMSARRSRRCAASDASAC